MHGYITLASLALNEVCPRSCT